MTIEQFIQKAIEGGWGKGVYAVSEGISPAVWSPGECAQMFLSPEAWKAVGKVRGWDGCSANHGEYWEGKPHWLYEMHRMIDALAEGKSIEEFLQAL